MKRFCLSILALACLAPLRAAEPVAWQQEFVFTQLPSALNSAWVQRGTAETSRIENHRLVIDPGDESYVGWIVNGPHGKHTNAIWHGNQPSTIEFRMSTRDLSEKREMVGASITLFDGQRVYRFSFRNREPYTYRIVLENGIAHRYILEQPDRPPTKAEGKEVEWDSRGGVTSNALVIGKFNTNVQGVSEWEFLRWTNEGAYHP